MIVSYRRADYLNCLADQQARKCLAQLHTGAYWLREETGKWQGLKRQHRSCLSSSGHLDDAQHMVCDCQALASVREQHASLLQTLLNLRTLLSKPCKDVVASVLACHGICQGIDMVNAGPAEDEDVI